MKIRIISFIAIFYFINNTFSLENNNRDNIKVIDPFNYDSRDNIVFKRIIDNTHLPDQFGDDNLNNPFHGLQFLLRWQFQSGRLFINDKHENIKNYSWWGCMNYYFSIVPYLSAHKYNLVPKLEFDFKFSNNSMFCKVYEECDHNMMSIWDNYFSVIRQIKDNKNHTYHSANDLLKRMWKGHQIGVEMGSKAFKHLHSNSLSKPEMILSNGWLAFVEALLTLNLNTNKTNIYSLQKSLPHRVLISEDYFPPAIKDFTYDQKTFTLLIYMMHYVSSIEFIYDPSIKLLQLISSNEQCRLLINNNINSFLQFPISTIIIVIIKIFTNTC